MGIQKNREYVLFLYVALWVLWRLQGIFLTSSLISLGLYIPFTLMTLMYVYQVIMKMAKPKTLSVLAFFFFVMLLYGGILLFTNNALGQKNTSFLIAIIGSIGPIFAFYVFARSGHLKDKYIYIFFVIFLVTSIFEFHAHQVKVLTMESRRFDDITNNVAYEILGLFPFIFLMSKRPVLQYLALSIVSYYVITGYKRGAILILAILMVMFIFYSIRYSKGVKRWLSLILVALLLCVGVYWLNDFYANSEYLQYRIDMTQDGDSSQRDIIYSTLWNHFISNNNLLHIIWGEGAYHTENVTQGLKAHNDWLELLIDCGVFGVMLYSAYWITFIIDLGKSRYNKSIYYVLASCLVYTFFRSMYSMSFTNIPLYMSMMMGYAFASLMAPVKVLKK